MTRIRKKAQADLWNVYPHFLGKYPISGPWTYCRSRCSANC